MGVKKLKYICINCNEEFEINRSQLTMCPYCNCETIEKNKYDKTEDDEALRGLSSSFSLQYLRRCDEWYNI